MNRFFHKNLINCQHSGISKSLFSRKFSSELKSSAELLETSIDRRRVTYIGMFMITGFLFSNYVYFAYYHRPEIYHLSEDEFHEFKLAEIIPLTKTSSLFRFEAIVSQAIDGTLPIPSHIVIKDDTCQIAREYSPTTFTKETFDIIVKKYEQGSLSRMIHQLQPGDEISARGPILSFPYKQNMAKEIGMIAGGTGITPMYQLIKKILADPFDETRISLLYANKNEHEILLINELNILSKANPDRFKVHLTIDESVGSVGEGKWSGDVGLVNENMIQRYMPKCNEDSSVVLVCGPPGMVRMIAGEKDSTGRQGQLGGILRKLGYTERNVFKF